MLFERLLHDALGAAAAGAGAGQTLMRSAWSSGLAGAEAAGGTEAEEAEAEAGYVLRLRPDGNLALTATGGAREVVWSSDSAGAAATAGAQLDGGAAPFLWLRDDGTLGLHRLHEESPDMREPKFK